jgi:hypothetical protein
MSSLPLPTQRTTNILTEDERSHPYPQRVLIKKKKRVVVAE